MFLLLLIVTFVISLIVSSIVAWFFAKPIDDILKRIINDPISSAWARYLQFAIYVVGISSGVRIYNLENYVNPQPNIAPLGLTRNRWVLEVYRTVVESLQGLAWVLLVFFVVSLIAFVIVRVFEYRHRQVA
jgi:ABC-type multidrug transport system fused ATPase/permease subunit